MKFYIFFIFVFLQSVVSYSQPKIVLSVDRVLFLGIIVPTEHTVPVTVYNKGNVVFGDN